jgi:hypothetical protein
MRIQLDLTEAARRHTDRHGFSEEITRLELGSWVQVGDRIVLDSAHPDRDLAVIRRRIVFRQATPELVLTLDHPARS